jgi:transposase
MQISTIGLDLAKIVFQAHGVSAEGKVVLKKQLRRGQVLSTFAKLPPCLVGMEACAGAHYWAREIGKLGDVRLMPARTEGPCEASGADAAAICEAVSDRCAFVALKTAEQQGRLMQHGYAISCCGSARRPPTRCGHMAELWLVAATGRQGLGLLLAILADARMSACADSASLKPLAPDRTLRRDRHPRKRLHAQHRRPGQPTAGPSPASA